MFLCAERGLDPTHFLTQNRSFQSQKKVYTEWREDTTSQRTALPDYSGAFSWPAIVWGHVETDSDQPVHAISAFDQICGTRGLFMADISGACSGNTGGHLAFPCSHLHQPEKSFRVAVEARTIPPMGLGRTRVRRPGMGPGVDPFRLVRSISDVYI